MKDSNDNEAWSRGGAWRHRKIENDPIRLKIDTVTNLSTEIVPSLSVMPWSCFKYLFT